MIPINPVNTRAISLIEGLDQVSPPSSQVHASPSEDIPIPASPILPVVNIPSSAEVQVETYLQENKEALGCFTRAKKFNETRKYTEAIDAAKNGIYSNPTNHALICRLFLQIGDGYYGKGDHPLALQQYLRAKDCMKEYAHQDQALVDEIENRLDPKRIDFENAICRVLLFVHNDVWERTEDRISALRFIKFIFTHAKISPEHKALLACAWATIHFDLNQFELALEMADRGLSILNISDDIKIPILGVKILSYSNMSNNHQAIQCAKKALTLKTIDQNYLSLAYVALVLSDPSLQENLDEKLALCQAGLSLKAAPIFSRGRLHCEIAAIYNKKREYVLAINEAAEGMKLKELCHTDLTKRKFRDVEILLRRERGYAESKIKEKGEECIEDLEKAVELAKINILEIPSLALDLDLFCRLAKAYSDKLDIEKAWTVIQFAKSIYLDKVLEDTKAIGKLHMIETVCHIRRKEFIEAYKTACSGLVFSIENESYVNDNLILLRDHAQKKMKL